MALKIGQETKYEYFECFDFENVRVLSINKIAGRNYHNFCPWQKVNKGPKLVRLHIGLLMGPKIAAWYDFCHIKNLKFACCPCLPP